MPEKNINGSWFWECNDTLISNYTRISNYGIGKHIVNNTGCGYRPTGWFGSSGTDLWESNGYMNRIMLIPDISIPANSSIMAGAKIADNPTEFYQNTGRYLQFSGRSACYWRSSLITNLRPASIVNQGMLSIGDHLGYIICYGGYGLKGNTLLGCCRDNWTGSEDIYDNYTSTIYDMRRQIAYGNWWNSYIPEVIKYADHVTVYRPYRTNEYPMPSWHQWGKGGYLSHPMYSYFRSASILYSNTSEPVNITESDAENENGNLVFDVYTSQKGVWNILCVLETWDSACVYPYSNDGQGDYSGGSRSTILMCVTNEGLLIGATGEMGGRCRSETECTYGGLASLVQCSGSKLTFEMVCDADYVNPTNNGPYVSASFAGHGINIKARVKSVD